MVRQRVSRRRRQIDVFLECTSGPTVFTVGIDVKDKKRPLGIEQVEQLCAKGRKLEIDRYVIISTSGFAEPASEEARREGVLTGSVERISDSKYFKLTHVTAPVITVQKLDMAFPDGVDGPPVGTTLGRMWVEDDTSCTRCDRLAFVLVGRLMQEEQAEPGSRWPEDQTHFVCVQDPDGRWKALYVDGAAWPPPAELHIWWTVKYEETPGVLLRADDGREIFTVITEIDGDYRQLTFIQGATAAETAGQGSRLIVDMCVLRPPRQNV
jgi:hypothetical protein